MSISPKPRTLKREQTTSVTSPFADYDCQSDDVRGDLNNMYRIPTLAEVDGWIARDKAQTDG